ncbi:solute carrier family 23 member 2 [Eurytemora carolleeae]|uniref:solute carrier family 23 member 2 n=1 Tax=Eurytemora carolleeae TaxID=1294199 RepID=UPI000C78D1AB|nr:solute carrier family 23 member 2 [Eurytemora carolleeae]|eukprot:XP_023325938.1 solute carrier family 23 member 2-like [Eurytemora affinis]
MENGIILQMNGRKGSEEKKSKDNEENGKENLKKTQESVLYKIEDIPPWYMCMFLGLQHYLTMFGGTISIPFILCEFLCIGETDPARGYIISTIFFVSGIVTLLQTTIGCRLPIIQGGTFTFIVPTLALLNLDKWTCKETDPVDPQEYWQLRMREVQGAIIVSSLLQVIIGYTGLLSLIMRWITPLTIGPSVAMIGLSLFDVAAHNASGHWGVAGGTILLMILFSQYLEKAWIPLPGRKNMIKFRVFSLFPVLLTILIMWGICGIYTILDGSNPNISVTARKDLFINSDWFRVPYPFQWGTPTVSVEGVVGMMAGVLASAIESVGDYYACARLSGAPPPPSHAISRGIGTEGLGCVIAGLMGTGNGTTSYSENIGAIGITKVGSRRVIQYAALIMIMFGVVNKFGALFLTIPTPIIGGIFCVMFGIITAVGLSNLQFVDLNSTRNLFVLGFSIFFALVLPKWMESEEGKGSIKTGSDAADQIITVLLSTSMFVAMFLGFVLDNTIPGTDEERGQIAWKNQHLSEENYDAVTIRCYDLPWITPLLKRISWTRYLPFSPTFQYW